MSYSKLHSSLVGSSLWGEKDSVRILFITMLAMCDKDGFVYGSRPGIERIAMIAKEDADEAWQTLMSPDKHSSDRLRAPENEGRRIEAVPGGFRLLNFTYYRGLRNDDDRREQNRIAQARHKAKVSRSKPRSALVSQGKPISEAEAEADINKTTSTTAAVEAVAVPSRDDFVKRWNGLGEPFAQIVAWTEQRQAAFRERVKNKTWVECWQGALYTMQHSKFCRGEIVAGNPALRSRPWIANVDWFLRPDSAIKLMEGKYDDARNERGQAGLGR